MKTLRSQIAVIGMIIGLAAPALAKAGLEVSIPKEAKLGQQVTVEVKTSPKNNCKIEAQDAGFTQSLKLLDQKADASGKVTWTFEIPKDYKADELPVTVTAQKDKEEDNKSVHSIKIIK